MGTRRPTGQPHPREEALAGMGWMAPVSAVPFQTTVRWAPMRVISKEYRRWLEET
jgi:hypothetical protein